MAEVWASLFNKTRSRKLHRKAFGFTNQTSLRRDGDVLQFTHSESLFWPQAHETFSPVDTVSALTAVHTSSLQISCLSTVLPQFGRGDLMLV